MRWETIDLKQEGRDHSLDFASLVLVRAFFGDGVEFIEEQDTSPGSSELECVVESGGGLAEEARHNAFVSNDVEGKHQLCCNGLGNAGLAIAGRPGQQEAVTRLDPIAAQQLGALLLFDQFGDDPVRHWG